MKRRKFLKSVGTILASSRLGGIVQGLADSAGFSKSPLARFKLGAISDGLSQDFEEALKILEGYGLSWVEIRNIWGKYNTEASPAEIQRIKDLLEKYRFKCSVVDTALYKCALPGTQPLGSQKEVYPYNGQMELLKRAAERAHAWGADKIRVFTFWRVAEAEKHFPHIAEELEKAAKVAQSSGVRLVVENESICNVATGRELASVLKLVQKPNVGANWDVGNGYWHGETSFPDGYRALDKKRIWHMHVKGVACGAGFKDCHETLIGKGQNDLAGQFRALLRDGYQETMSLECEFKAPGMSHSETSRRSLESLLQVVSRAIKPEGSRNSEP